MGEERERLGQQAYSAWCTAQGIDLAANYSGWPAVSDGWREGFRAIGSVLASTPPTGREQRGRLVHETWQASGAESGVPDWEDLPEYWREVDRCVGDAFRLISHAGTNDIEDSGRAAWAAEGRDPKDLRIGVGPVVPRDRR